MKQFSVIVLFITVLISCNKKEEDNPHDANGTNFTSIRQYDVHAVHIGSIGNATDDYQQEVWPDWVMDLFKPLDTVNLTGYIQSEITVDRLYPNPCADTQTLRYFATQPVNLKIVLIDQEKNVYLRKSFHLPSAIHDLGLKYDSLHMAANKHYRLFYGFSAQDKPFFNRGHIDILKDR